MKRGVYLFALLLVGCGHGKKLTPSTHVVTIETCLEMGDDHPDWGEFGCDEIVGKTGGLK